MVYRPPFQLPTQFGTDVYPDVMQQPMRVQLGVDASPQWWAMNPDSADAAGDQITQHYAGNLSRFVSNQRQQHALAGAQVRRRQMTVPGLSATYTVVNGMEILAIQVTPESAPIVLELPQIVRDFNYDGYLAFWLVDISAATGIDADSAIVTLDFFLNNRRIGGVSLFFDNNDNTDVRDKMWLFKFGHTALRCHSLVDAANPNRLHLTNPIIPKRRDIPARTAVDLTAPGGGSPESRNIPAYHDLLKYFVFDWSNPLNRLSGFFRVPEIVETVDFPDHGDGPLKITGVNVFEVRSSFMFRPANVQFQMLGEFYSRHATRMVQTSWRQASDTSSILVNDKPLYIVGETETDVTVPPVLTEGGSFQSSLTFDLSPKQDDPNAIALGDLVVPQRVTI